MRRPTIPAAPSGSVPAWRSYRETRHAESTAFPHRQIVATMLLTAMWDATVNQAPHIDWLRQYWRELEPHTRGFYTNDAIEESQRQIDDNYAGNLPRLVALKNRYDLTNLFRLNANIVPKV